MICAILRGGLVRPSGFEPPTFCSGGLRYSSLAEAMHRHDVLFKSLKRTIVFVLGVGPLAPLTVHHTAHHITHHTVRICRGSTVRQPAELPFRSRRHSQSDAPLKPLPRDVFGVFSWF